MSGLPASGKSTYCEAKGKEHGDIIIHRDVVRQHLRELLGSSDYFPCEPGQEYEFYMQYIRTAASASMKDIWIDQTTLSCGAAKKLIYALSKIINLDEVEINIEILNTPYEVCCERNATREGVARVPDEVMVSMQRGFNISSLLAYGDLPSSWRITINNIKYTRKEQYG